MDSSTHRFVRQSAFSVLRRVKRTCSRAAWATLTACTSVATLAAFSKAAFFGASFRFFFSRFLAVVLAAAPAPAPTLSLLGYFPKFRFTQHNTAALTLGLHNTTQPHSHTVPTPFGLVTRKTRTRTHLSSSGVEPCSVKPVQIVQVCEQRQPRPMPDSWLSAPRKSSFHRRRRLHARPNLEERAPALGLRLWAAARAQLNPRTQAYPSLVVRACATPTLPSAERFARFAAVGGKCGKHLVHPCCLVHPTPFGSETSRRETSVCRCQLC
jgi:hypothetical protein